MKVRLVERKEIADWDSLSDEALKNFEETLAEKDMIEATEELDDAQTEPVAEEEEAPTKLVDSVIGEVVVEEELTETPVAQILPEVTVEEIERIDITMVGKVLTRSVQNTTEGVWRKCYPGAFWIRDGRRLSDPATKGQCIGDIRPGLMQVFVVVVPKFPLGEKPDMLRIAILEDGVGWHTVEDLRVR